MFVGEAQPPGRQSQHSQKHAQSANQRNIAHMALPTAGLIYQSGGLSKLIS